MRTITLFFSLAFTLIGCGKSSAPTPTDTTNTSPATPTDAAATTASATTCACPEHSFCAYPGCAVDPAWVIEDIHLGYSFGCARYKGGTVRCAGTNESGQLGSGSASKPPDAFLPPIEVREAKDAKQIAVGAAHACALLRNGSSKCWGLGEKGEIGSGFTGMFTRPDPVVGLDDASFLMTSTTGTCGIDSGGSVWCWGANDLGQLGDGTHDDKSTPTKVKDVASAKSIASDGLRVCALLQDGHVSCWGRKTPGKTSGPEIIKGLEHVDEIAMSSHILFARSGGKISTLSTAMFESDIGTKADITDAAALAVGRDHACVLRATGTVVCFGANERGQLNDGTTTTRPDARATKDTAPTKLLAASADITCAVHNDDTLSCWGDEKQGLAKIALLGAAPPGSPAHVIPALPPLPTYVPTPGTSVVEVKLTDALKLATGTLTPPSRSTLYYRLPASWLDANGVRPEKKDAILAKLYGRPDWQKGNKDGSTYVVQSFDARILKVDDESTRPWLTAPTPKWFYVVLPDGKLQKINQDKF